MSLGTHDAIMMASVLVAMISMLWLIGKLAKHFNIAPEMKRKIAHVATGLTSLSFPWLFSNPLPVIIMIAISLLTMAGLRSELVKNHSMSAVLHDVQRKSYGEFYLLAAVGLLFTRSIDNPVLYVLPLTVIALSDTASALVGTKYGRRRFAVAGGEKSIEGGVAFFTVTLVVSLILLMLLTEAPEINVIALSVLVAAFCTLVEADSWKGLDNIFVPVGAHLLLSEFLDAPPDDLAKILVFIVFSILAMHRFAPLFNLTQHSGRAYVLLSIMIVAATPNHQAVFPLLAILTHLFARKSHASPSPNRDLHMIGATAAVALLWMFADDLAPQSAFELFNLTFASVAVIFIGLAMPGKMRFLAIPAAVLMGGLYVLVSASMVDQTVWSENKLALPLASLGLSAFMVCLFPRWFNYLRSIKAYGVALIVPVFTFFIVGVLA